MFGYQVEQPEFDVLKQEELEDDELRKTLCEMFASILFGVHEP